MIQAIPAFVPRDASADYLVSFCHTITPNAQPRYIPNKVSKTSRSGNCFNNVADYVAQHGGEVRYGWCLWETPSIILQAEFHAVWLSPMGELIDITPHNQTLRNNEILFFLDTSKSYTGVRVNNRRIALLDEPIIHDYLTAQDQLFAQSQHYMNDQREQLQNDEQRQIALDQVNLVLKQFKDSHLALERFIKKRWARNDPCPCGSGLKCKKCCYP